MGRYDRLLLKIIQSVPSAKYRDCNTLDLVKFYFTTDEAWALRESVRAKTTSYTPVFLGMCLRGFNIGVSTLLLLAELLSIICMKLTGLNESLLTLIRICVPV